MEKKNLGIHITYNEALTLKELSELLHLINLSVNDYYRDNGVSNQYIANFSPTIEKVKEGSIIFELLFPEFFDITAQIIAEYIIPRLRTMWNNEKNREQNRDIKIEANNNTVQIGLFIINK